MKESLETIVQRKVNLGDTVKLDCTISYHFEITWLRHGPGQIPSVLLVAKLDDDGKILVVLRQSDRFVGVISNRSIALTVTDIKEDDYALYYCTGKEGRTLQFGKGTQLMDPADSATQPVTKVCGGCERAPVPANHSGSAGPANHSGSGGALFYPLYVAVLGCGQLGMICAVATAHLRSRRRPAD